MSSTYTTNLDYDHFINNVKDIEIRDPVNPVFIVPHKNLYKNRNGIFAFKADELWDGRKGSLCFEVYGANDPTEMFNLFLSQFPEMEIIDDLTGLNYGE